MINKKTIGLILIILLVIFMTACTSSISDIKNEDKIGKKVFISGTVEGSLKLGDISGYTLRDDSDSIFISSNNLPEKGTKKTIRGTLEKNLLGFYINTK